MRPYLHCFWTGGSFPYNFKVFIRKWAAHLQKSNSRFRLIVWCTKDAYDIIQGRLSADQPRKQWQAETLEDGLKVLKVSADYNSFYLADFAHVFEKMPDSIKKLFNTCVASKLYTSASNLARIFITNHFEGIYTDVDFLMPNLKQPFPPDMSEIAKAFSGFNSNGFYLPAYYYVSAGLCENQCIVVLAGYQGCFQALINEIAHEAATKFDRIHAQGLNNLEYLAHPKTQALNKTLFMEPEFKRFLEAYNQKLIENFSFAVERYYDEMYHSTPELLESQETDFNPHFAFQGDRFSRMHWINLYTYEYLVDFFLKIFPNDTEFDLYARYSWEVFGRFFDQEAIRAQFKMRDKRGVLTGIYSWSHPGYSRLKSLDDAAKVVQRKYREKKYHISSQPLNALVARLMAECPKIGDRTTADTVMDCLKVVQMELGKIHSLPPEGMKAMLKQLISVVLMTGKSGGSPPLAVRMITEVEKDHSLEDVRKLLSPDKERLGLDDLIGFLSC